MRRRVTAQVLEGGIFVLRGWHAHKLALEAGLRPTYSGVHQGWMADTKRLSTFEAYCAHRHVALDVDHPDVEDLGVHCGDTVEESQPKDAPLFELDGGR